MLNIFDSFGKNAGKVWSTINSDGSITENQLKKKTKLSTNDLYNAVGWLARENKICKYDMTFKLGETNLTNKIGKDAGKVWRVLDTWGEVDASSISRLARIEEKEVFSAIGWLAREGKIEGKKIKSKQKKMKFWLK